MSTPEQAVIDGILCVNGKVIVTYDHAVDVIHLANIHRVSISNGSTRFGHKLVRIVYALSNHDIILPTAAAVKLYMVLEEKLRTKDQSSFSG